MRQEFDVEWLKENIYNLLRLATVRDYAVALSESPAFVDAVRDDVEQTSAWEEEGYFNQRDVRLAIGRVICEKFGVEV